MKVLTIERAKWLRGEGNTDSYMLRPSDGKMCCLGFDALAHGLLDGDIRNAGDPQELGDAPESYLERMLNTDYDEDGTPYYSGMKPAVKAAIDHNDDRGFTDDERERLIREDLKALGWDDVVFV